MICKELSKVICKELSKVICKERSSKKKKKEKKKEEEKKRTSGKFVFIDRERSGLIWGRSVMIYGIRDANLRWGISQKLSITIKNF